MGHRGDGLDWDEQISDSHRRRHASDDEEI